MNKVASCLVLAAFAASSLSVVAAPAKPASAPVASAASAKLEINPKEFGPLSTIELKFATPMIDKAKVGSIADPSPMEIVPNLPGKFEWTSTRSGIYRPSEAPKFDSSYRFSLRAGLKDIAGAALPAEKLRDCMTEKFRVVEQYPRWFNEDNFTRSPKFLFEFNDPVALETVAPAFKFKCAKSKLVLDATARLATGKDFRRHYADPHQTWAEQIAGTEPKLKPEDVRDSAVVIEPVHPLDPGEEWTLEIATTVVNKGNTSKLDTGDSIQLGTVQPFAITEITARTPFDVKPRIDIDFNKPIGDGKAAPADAKPDRKAIAASAAPHVKVEPAVADLTYVINEDETLSVVGSFEFGKEYHVSVAPEIVSNDDLKLVEAGDAMVEFHPNPPYVAAPGFVNAQMASGKGEFEFSSANVTQIRMRAKKMTGPQMLQAIADYEPYQSNHSGNNEERKKFTPKPIDEYPGTVIFDRTFPMNQALDQSALTKITWREVLGKDNAAPLFIELEGVAVAGVEGKKVIAQTLVEFTDIGLFHKNDFQSSTVLAVSLGTGKPLPNVQITLVDDKHRLIGHGATDANGMVTVPAPNPFYVLAESGSDATAMHVDGYQTLVPLWHFNVSTRWNSPWEDRRKTFLFADRPLFRPGETAHLKAYTRIEVGDELKLDSNAATATLKITDPRGKVVLEKKASFSASGSWSDDVLLPTNPTGWYRATLTFGGKGEEDDSYGSGALSLRVDDYKPNTFEVSFNDKEIVIAPEQIKVPLKANYYMGKPLSQAKVTWNAFRQVASDVPEQYVSYHFGDAPRWASYGVDRDADEDSHDSHAKAEWNASGETAIGEDGTLTIEMPTPPAVETPLPQSVFIDAEVTDINEQTIGTSTQFTLPGPTFMLGLRSPGWFARAGMTANVEAIAITPDGKAHSPDVPVQVKLEHQAYHILKVQAAGGAETTKNQVVLEEELNTTATLHAATPEHPASLSLPITPKQSGAYFLTVSAEVDGRKVFSRLPIYVLGGTDFPWAMQEGNQIDLQVDKTTLKPGDKASIVVKTPIAGTALVTIERNKIQRTFQQPISPEHPMIEVPVSEEDAPNVFVSVMVIRGAQDSPQTIKMPDYRIGYAQLHVGSAANDLVIEVKPDQPEFRPGSPAAITASVKDAAGKPVAGAEVTLAAVDEGVLSLMNYVTPEPSEFFNEPAPLAVRTHTNFGEILTEDAQVRERGNKGYVIGGGGDDSEANVPRKNFLATALWTATALTDASGQVKSSFTTPDNLTRFRLMAIASEGARRFGSAQGAVVVNKPLMLEPALPRFARIGDELLVKAVLHNTTDQSGEATVKCTLDDRSDFIANERAFVLVSLNAGSTKPEGKLWTKKVMLKAKETVAVSFPVKFTTTGTAKWKWEAKLAALSDATESTFNVEHPMQEKRDVHYFQLAGDKLPDNAIKDVHPTLLEGDGTVTVTLSNSRLVEVADALDYVLHYPYGCVEQTTSAMIPWLALGGFNDLFPQLDKAKSKAAIQTGVNRLLSMVTDRGGLAYWPGGKDPQLFASAYGGMGLLKAREAGAAVPKQTIDELLAWLSENLRHVDDERDTTTLVDDALALYTLAKGGRPEPAFENMLFARRAKLPTTGKLYLALAMCVSNAPETQIRTLLNEGSDATWNYFTGTKVNNAMRLLAYAHIGEKTAAAPLVDSVMAMRNANGEWGNTYTNAWMLTALAGYERSMKLESAPLAGAAELGTAKQALDLPKPGSRASAAFPLNADLSKQPLKLTIPKDRHAFARVETKAWPKLVDFAGENAGYGITRVYEKLLPDGNTEDLSNARVGDMIIVRLTVDLPAGGDRYLAINDPLPAVFEAINPEFDTQNVRRNAAPAGVEAWFCDFRELRTDRALFFTDYCPGKGKFELNYLARVVAEGDVIAPSASIEAMYEPAKHGLSATQRIKTLPLAVGAKVADK